MGCPPRRRSVSSCSWVVPTSSSSCSSPMPMLPWICRCRHRSSSPPSPSLLPLHPRPPAWLSAGRRSRNRSRPSLPPIAPSLAALATPTRTRPPPPAALPRRTPPSPAAHHRRAPRAWGQTVRSPLHDALPPVRTRSPQLPPARGTTDLEICPQRQHHPCLT
ncbi:hypothetical protein BS78_03G000100 [Paspalum vaginatum]|nr:hypothetical protein BS78_03G000100 [Paspalum vaginatum]